MVTKEQVKVAFEKALEKRGQDLTYLEHVLTIKQAQEKQAGLPGDVTSLIWNALKATSLASILAGGGIGVAGYYGYKHMADSEEKERKKLVEQKMYEDAMKDLQKGNAATSF